MTDEKCTAADRQRHQAERAAAIENQKAANMTKREAFAMAAMQGLLSNGNNGSEDAYQIATWAVTQADMLLAQMERTK